MIKKLRKEHASNIVRINSFFYRDGGAKLEPLQKYHDIVIPTKKIDFSSLLKKMDVTHTPLVIMVDNRIKKVVDTYSPVPNDYSRRSAFEKKWNNLLE